MKLFGQYEFKEEKKWRSTKDHSTHPQKASPSSITCKKTHKQLKNSQYSHNSSNYK